MKPVEKLHSRETTKQTWHRLVNRAAAFLSMLPGWLACRYAAGPRLSSASRSKESRLSREETVAGDAKSPPEKGL